MIARALFGLIALLLAFPVMAQLPPASGVVASVSGGTTGLTPSIATTGAVVLGLPSTSSTASQLVARNASQNAFANNFVSKATNVTSAGGTTILTGGSARTQNLTGVLTQTFRLPNATTLTLGAQFQFNNNSTDNLLIHDSASTLLATVGPGAYVFVRTEDVSTAAGSWDIHYTTPHNSSWSNTALVIGGAVGIGGATIGSNALAVTGTANISGATTVGSLITGTVDAAQPAWKLGAIVAEACVLDATATVHVDIGGTIKKLAVCQ